HGAHHGVALATPNVIEDAAKAHPAFALDLIVTTWAHWHRFVDHPGFGVRHDQVRVDGLHAHRCGQTRHQANTRSQHLTIIFPGTCRGADDAIYQCNFTHLPASSEHGQGQALDCVHTTHFFQIFLLRALHVLLLVVVPAALFFAAGHVFLEVLDV